ncbi:MAG: lipopolysaccharide kinase InaA family protein, partial [Zoogloeaceae bacterium]|nr:lipopolysaccharide kinase InaA family protein [Zoogloeaceae bacterium]
MVGQDFIAATDLPLLQAAGLTDFNALWRLELEAVEPPNTDRGGWSSVCRLELPEQGYFLKRQSNHLTRSLAHPFGEPTFAREFRNIRRYAERQVPALSAAFFGIRKVAGEQRSEQRAILLTRALSSSADWRDLASWLADWSQCSAEQRAQLLDASALLARRLHAARLTHCCFYPRHIFVRSVEQGFAACLIDLEK